MGEQEVREEIINILDRIDDLLSAVRTRVIATPKKDDKNDAG